VRTLGCASLVVVGQFAQRYLAVNDLVVEGGMTERQASGSVPHDLLRHQPGPRFGGEAAVRRISEHHLGVGRMDYAIEAVIGAAVGRVPRYSGSHVRDRRKVPFAAVVGRGELDEFTIGPRYPFDQAIGVMVEDDGTGHA